MKQILALVPEAFGGFGGIAQAEADLLEAFAKDPRVGRIDVLARLIRQEPVLAPAGIDMNGRAALGKPAFVRQAIGAISRDVDLVFCGHLNLAALSMLVARACRARSVLMIHGIESWSAPRSPLTRIAVGRFDYVVSVSRVSSRRFREWSGIPRERIVVIPNRVDLDSFRAGPADPEVVERYRLDDRRVLMTLGRIDPPERHKGFHEMLDALPHLVAASPDLLYVIAGDGEGKPGLERRVAELGMTDHVRFTGRVSEDEKRELYRAADLFVMPSRGEGFGIVILEALASGTPVVGSRLDGTMEATMNGRLGALVDPRDLDQMVTTILAELGKKRTPDERLRFYDIPCHERRVRRLLDRLWEDADSASTRASASLS